MNGEKRVAYLPFYAEIPLLLPNGVQDSVVLASSIHYEVESTQKGQESLLSLKVLRG
jgi:hypothetical protein